MNELRIAIRSLRRAPLFSVASILTLALGIALAVAAFSLIDGALIRPMPFKNSGELIVLAQSDTRGALGGVSYPNFLDWKAQANPQTFAGLAYVRGRGTPLELADGKQTVIVALTSEGFFGVLQPRLALGRGFTPEEERAGTHVAVVTNGMWRTQLGGDAQVIGRTITTGDGAYTVVGVLPRDLVMPEWAQLYIPLAAVAGGESVLNARNFTADSRTIARLRPGVTATRAQVELSGIAGRLAKAYPGEDANWPGANVQPLDDALLGSGESHLVILGGAMLLVLLVGWVNVINLALVRATGRTRELAVRTSLGASRMQLIRQLMLEHLILALIAGAIGVAAAAAGIDLVRALASDVPRTADVTVHGTALIFALLIAIVSALVVGALPALRATRVGLVDSLKAGGSGAGSSGRQQRIRGALVAGEIALALTLVIVAGLLVRSYWQLSAVDPGFDTGHLVAIDLSPPGKTYAEPKQAGLFYGRVLEAVRAIPGADRAALTNHMPLNGAALTTTVAIPGRVADPANDPQVLFRTLSPEYLATLVIPIKQGRGFVEADLAGGDAVLINQSLAKAFWPDGDPVGKQVMLHKSAQGFADYGEPLAGTIVGVIGDVHHFGVAARAVPEIYLPYTRNPWSHMVVVVRAHGAPSALIPAMRRAILGVDPNTILTGGVFGGFQEIEEIRSASVGAQRFTMQLYGAFALGGLLLAAIGIYGLMAYAVAQRTREIGIRMALGAHATDVVGLVLAGGARLIAVGVIVGLAMAVAVTRLAASLLFGVSATDIPTFVVTTVVLAAVALIACYLPARRASRVEPVVALRAE